MTMTSKAEEKLETDHLICLQLRSHQIMTNCHTKYYRLYQRRQLPGSNLDTCKSLSAAAKRVASVNYQPVSFCVVVMKRNSGWNRAKLDKQDQVKYTQGARCEK